ncbi:PspA/IM30 family protein [Radiobacillus kanasensis]|uniref:PspA/IM30 family protein n=1 Tax=Radiobacillus kanasensis TaxID=2844358 RepID=UPI001E51BB22|nr:PspA/IM30 family protein [Radiobacillus kanasensis]UFT98625.1 PspA/IM30 family protein [Radiobacillus kanasensis]
MSNLFTRLKDTVVADFHEMLDQKEEKNPMIQLNEYVRQCEQQAKKIRALVEKQYLVKQEFSKEYNHAKVMLEKRTRQAELAAEAGEVELQEHAEQEKELYQERVDKLSALRDQSIKELEMLESKYEQMKYKIKELYVKRLELKGRENVAKAHQGMNRVLQSDLASKSISKFSDLENYIERLEEKVKSDYRMHTLDARLAELEKNKYTTT